MLDDYLQMQGISKSFGGIAALSDASFSARAGEVHGLMGENGAGKSTLMKILAGAYHRDEGAIRLDGAEQVIAGPNDAIQKGISVIYQEFSLARHLSVAENILIEELGHSGGLVNWESMAQRAGALLSDMGFDDIAPLAEAGSLPVAYQQVVEICKALSRDCKTLVFDEPTAVLTHHETEKLFALIEKLRARGVCIIYISHRLEEIFALCDRVTVLKDGQTVGTYEIGDLNEQALINLMIGRDLAELFPPRDIALGEVRLKVDRLSRGSEVQNVSFEVRAGEVLGFSGLVGAGRTETMRTIFGADRAESGQVSVNGRIVSNRSPGQGVSNGIGMLPEDRKQEGVLLDMPIRVNAMMTPLNRLISALGLIDGPAERAETRRLSDLLRLKAGSIDDPVSSLSGGNQQKVALMKWLAAECSVLILDEPTRGVDVGAKVEIYRVINDLAAQGIAIIMVSSEMIEVMGMSDRIVVMRHGEVAGELAKAEFTEQRLLELAMGHEEV